MISKDSNTVDFPVRKRGEPFPPREYSDFRNSAGLVKTKLPSGQPVWLVSRHADVRAVLTDPRISANPANPGFPKVAKSGGVPTQEEMPGWFVGLDPPEHDRFRKVLIPEFSVRRIRQWRPTIQQTVDECVDALLTAGTSADLVTDLALPVPSRVIATILGVPQEDRAFFESRTQTLVSLADTTEGQRAEATRQLQRYLSRLIAIKQKWPAEDLISRILGTGQLSAEEMVGVTMLLLIAGHETTANNIALGVTTLLANPQWIGNDRTVDELVRFYSVADIVAIRTAVEDVEIGGQLIKAGEGIMPLLAAANRDACTFDEPDGFNPDRSARSHVGFGYGVHQCLGQNLVRVEMECVYRTLFDRIPTLRLTQPIQELPFKYDGTIFGLHSLPVSW
jgi:cytochrome P450 monooxygenase